MPSSQYIIQLDLPLAGRQSLDTLAEELARCGVELDRGYGPVCINPTLQRYVLRGVASIEARRAAEQIAGIQFFADAPVEGAAKGFGPAR